MLLKHNILHYEYACFSMSQGFSTVAKATLEDIGGGTAPLMNFDPLRLAQLGSEPLLWFRAAELKNGRVAMLATAGYMVQASGFHFPGMLTPDISFESLSAMKPFDAWAAVGWGRAPSWARVPDILHLSLLGMLRLLQPRHQHPRLYDAYSRGGCCRASRRPSAQKSCWGSDRWSCHAKPGHARAHGYRCPRNCGPRASGLSSRVRPGGSPPLFSLLSRQLPG